MVFVKSLRKIKRVKPKISNLQIRRISTQTDLADLKALFQLDVDFKNSVDCFIALLDGRIVHTTSVDYANALSPVFFRDHTVPELRGKHICPFVKTKVFEYLRNRGIKKVYISCADYNLSSRAAIKRAGFKILMPGLISRLKMRVTQIFNSYKNENSPNPH